MRWSAFGSGKDSRNMGTLEIAYKILYELEHGEKKPYMGIRIAPEKVGASPEKWAEVIKSLSDAGYVRGVVFRENVLGEQEIDIKNAAITLSGAQYLKENSAFSKFARVVTDVITIAKL